MNKKKRKQKQHIQATPEYENLTLKDCVIDVPKAIFSDGSQGSIRFVCDIACKDGLMEEIVNITSITIFDAHGNLLATCDENDLNILSSDYITVRNIFS